MRGVRARRAGQAGGKSGDGKKKKKAAGNFTSVVDKNVGLELPAEPVDFLGQGETLRRRWQRFMRSVMVVYGMCGALAVAHTHVCTQHTHSHENSSSLIGVGRYVNIEYRANARSSTNATLGLFLYLSYRLYHGRHDDHGRCANDFVCVIV